MRRRSMRPVSNRRQQEIAAQEREERAGAAVFRQQIVGERCVVCGRTSAEAFKATGYPHQAHHGIRKEVLRRLGLQQLLWDPRNAIAVCEEPCHRQHTNRMRRISRSALPARVISFVDEHRLHLELEREYPEAAAS